MKLSKAKAKEILLEEAAAANAGVDKKWRDRLTKFSRMCVDEARTHIAFLGTALLAKSVNSRADVFSVKRRSGKGALPGAYSARGVVGVLAENARALGVNLGATGREPLNNQPYFHIDRLTRQTVVKKGFEGVLSALCDILDDVQDLESEQEARKILRAYIAVRREFNPAYALLGKVSSLTPRRLADIISDFVNAEGERGKRAQAVAAGLLDMFAGIRKVETARVHDPDVGFPGDVAIKSSIKPYGPEKVLEVRDKPVSHSDVEHFIAKVAERNITSAALLAAASAQTALDTSALEENAYEHGIFFRLFLGWHPFVFEAIFWASHTPSEAVELAIERIYIRLIEQEVSQSGVEAWTRLVAPTS